jgi:hypothetical protein
VESPAEVGKAHYLQGATATTLVAHQFSVPRTGNWSVTDTVPITATCAGRMVNINTDLHVTASPSSPQAQNILRMTSISGGVSVRPC